MSDQLMKYQCLNCQAILTENKLLWYNFPETKIRDRVLPAKEVPKCSQCRGRVVLIDENKKFTIVSENETKIIFSNGDGVYEGCGIYKGRWLIDSKKKRKKAVLKATTKKDALEEYQFRTSNLLQGNS
jgi:hypothetical protein